MLAQHDVKQMIIEVARKFGGTEHDVFVWSAAYAHQDVDSLIEAWKQGRHPAFFENALIDFLAHRSSPPNVAGRCVA